jgi:hypothetical protein
MLVMRENSRLGHSAPVSNNGLSNDGLLSVWSWLRLGEENIGSRFSVGGEICILLLEIWFLFGGALWS